MEILNKVKKAKDAAHQLASLSTTDKNAVLSAIAKAITANEQVILAENALDLQSLGNEDAVFADRLTLTSARISQMCQGVNEVIALSDPVGEVTAEWTRPNGLKFKTVRAPLGVIAIVYEARPNVTVDAAALCIKSGNAVILRGGSGAINSNRALNDIMRTAIEDAGYNPEMVQFIDDVTRESVKELLSYDDYIDVVIPRGGEGLKHFIADNSKIPVIASAGGNCHVYVEKSADLTMAETVAVSAKISRPSVCNAAEHLLVDRKIAKVFLPKVVKSLIEKGVKVTGDAETVAITGVQLAADSDYDVEYHDMEMSVKVVDGVNEAIAHINAHGTKHSEAILTTNESAAKAFEIGVDAAAVYVNASTRFTDGFEFGFGAEMGISTGKLHARGPIGLRQLTSEKYLVEGNGQIR